MDEVGVEVPLPTGKLSVDTNRDGGGWGGVVLVATGSFNPPTYMHLRMFELAKDELQQRGYRVLGGYMSPVNDAYKKKDLLPAAHRIHFCELACKSSSFVMVDSWEAMQKCYQRTLTVLSRIRNSLHKDGLADQGSLKVMLLCGSDLLESFSTPGVWIPDQVRTICKDFGVICIRREGKDVGKLIANSEVLQECRDNIILVEEIVPNQISSSRVRDCIRRCLSIKYLTCDEVIEYIREHKLFMEAEGSDTRL
ncbi:nicotinamide/nicotinic acid mononucleotide adenylyltransferase [Phragmites australis]|uniref:nicotinamide/nicotinic acid mononucleotide adenylyltransferase n=1 Tax=Phragmites australis TaxID=29695 RepID=UPI002D7663FE|nr:nicotinamide/nicotinic acid mononucleotide adenylyltransferase [Phragmites australis]XP_062221584.1 nicotinamide/nicotinic acid mononucleotide adenylyltransferase [Phragmites australis]